MLSPLRGSCGLSSSGSVIIEIKQGHSAHAARQRADGNVAVEADGRDGREEGGAASRIKQHLCQSSGVAVKRAHHHVRTGEFAGPGRWFGRIGNARMMPLPVAAMKQYLAEKKGSGLFVGHVVYDALESLPEKES